MKSHKTAIMPSTIEGAGLGVFAKEEIYAGEIIEVSPVKLMHIDMFSEEVIKASAPFVSAAIKSLLASAYINILVAAEKELESCNIELKYENEQLQKIINQGEFVGYGMNYCSKERVKIGIIPFGYADGIYEKKNSDNYYVFIKNNKYKVIGDISMDSLAVNLENSKIEEGDKVILFDSNYTIKEIAKSCNTSEYEILSKLNRRIKREYYS